MQYQLSRMVAGPFLHTIWRPKVTGAENIPASGGAILATNHLSVAAIQRLSGQEYVPMFASDRKAELAATARPAP